MKQNKNKDKKQLPEKTQVANPKRETTLRENYGTKERPTHPKGADQMNENFAKPGADQNIIREASRSAETGRGRKDLGR